MTPTVFIPSSTLDCGTSTGDVVAHRRAAVHVDAPDPLTQRTHRVWSAGDYDRISAGFRHEAAAFVARQAPKAGLRVLDVACGSGNLTIPAARYGADVTGLDLVASLIGHAAAWATREGLSIQLDEGNAEALPYADARFDLVLSMFGVMFAARPDLAVSELGRVTRPGGRVALANWTREGFVGQMLATHVKYAAPPAGVPSPLLWGNEATIRERFPESEWAVTTERRMLTFRYALSPAGIAELFRGTYGPTVRTFESIDEDQRARFASDLTGLWTSHHRAAEGVTEVDSEYLEVVAIRR